jgi:hypothetical protein
MVAYPVAAASVWTTDSSGTNKTDFAPGDTVYISGSGFDAANESYPVQIQVTRPADSEGVVTTNTCPDPELYWCPEPLPTTPEFSLYPYTLDGIEGTYTIDATDGTNPAQTTFTDTSPHIYSITILQPTNAATVPSPVRVYGRWNVTNPGDSHLDHYNVQIVWGDGTKTDVVNINRTSQSKGYYFRGTFDTQPITGCSGSDDNCNAGAFNHTYNTATSCGPFTITVKLYHAQPPGTESGDASASVMIYIQEDCSNGVDDDCDGKIDCADSDCSADPSCVTSCGNGVLEQGEQCESPFDSCCDSNTCQFKPAQTVCRAAAGGCDVAETCTGASAACPADGVQPNTYVCRTSAGICDLVDYCDGSTKVCPADAKSTAVCRASAGDCDVAESCDGTHNDCPIDAFKSSSYVCRASAGVCDLEDKCTGSSALCPADAKSTAQCRAQNGQCDVAENCDGTNNNCPADAKAPFSTPCDDGLWCSATDHCNGNGNCVQLTARDCSDGVSCTTDSCDEAGDRCVYTPNNTQCNDGNACTVDTCDVEKGCVYTLSDITGPVTSNIAVVPSFNNGVFDLSATVTDSCSAIKTAEYFIGHAGNASCGAAGTGTPIYPKDDGSFNLDKLSEDLFKAGVSFYVDGSNYVCIRGRDNSNNWGNCTCVYYQSDIFGPEEPVDVTVNGVPVDPNNVQEILVCGQDPVIKAKVCDSQSNIQGGSYYVDTYSTSPGSYPDPWAGNWMNAGASWIEGTWHCANLTDTVEINEMTDGTHNITLMRGKDNKENWGKVLEYYIPIIKDTTAPQTEKTLNPADGRKVDCSDTQANGQTLTNGCEYVKLGTTITLNAVDPDPQKTGEFAGNVVIHYNVYWSYDGTSWTLAQSGSSNVNQPITITLNSDSYHLVEYWSTDGCSNFENKHYELDIVDGQAPNVSKTVDDPKIASTLITNYTMPDKNFDVKDTAWYIKQSTPITLSCTDVQPHPVGGEKIYYKYYVDGVLHTDWTQYTGAITYNEDTYHELYYYCEDALGNIGAVHYELDIVDTAAPEVSKSVAEPKVESTQITEYLVPDRNYQVKDTAWYIQQGTQITLSCTDVQPHPVGGEKIYYKYYVDGVLHTDWTQYTGAITYNEDTYHELYYYCEDALGNIGAVHYELDIVDTVGPEVIGKEITGPNIECEGGNPYNCDYFITQDSVLHISASDPEQHPVGIDYCQYRYSVDGGEFTEWTTATDVPELDSVSNHFVFNVQYPEDSVHTLEVKCVDLLGNWGPVYTETDVVDTQAPEQKKTLGTPLVVKDGYTYITQQTPITITCNDLEPHPVNDVTIEYQYRIKENIGDDWPDWPETWTSVNSNTTTFTFPENSVHELRYRCYDALGNYHVTESEIDIVDTQPPETTKVIGEPKMQFPEVDALISDHTPITLTCTDGQPHPVGGEKIYWQWQYSADGEIWGEWSAPALYTVPITFSESSFHRIKYWCVDALENTEEVHTELDAVDATPPVTTKTIGKLQYYNETTGDMWITQQTPITLECTDPGLHQSGVDAIYYRYNVDGGERTEWTEYEEPFTFGEDSVHTLEYYCVDNFGNQEATQTEVDKVDSTPPETKKTFVGPTCAEDEDDQQNYWITSDTEITLSATDGGDTCAIGVDHIHYETYWSTDEGEHWTLLNENDVYGNSVTFHFNEECLHKIVWYAVDELGNEEETHTQYHRVDNSAPEITKTVGWPSNYWGENPETGEDTWDITSDTKIQADIEDQTYPCAVGSVTTKYSVWYDLTGEWSPWYDYTGPFTLYGDSTHRVNITATDCLGNTAYDVETFIVHENYPGDPCIVPRDVQVFGPYWRSFELPSNIISDYTNDNRIWNVLKTMKGQYAIVYFQDYITGEWSSFDPSRVDENGKPINSLNDFGSTHPGKYWIKMTGSMKDRSYITIYNDLKDGCEMTLPQCSDRLDNDADKYWDYGYDPQCDSPEDTTEAPIVD